MSKLKIFAIIFFCLFAAVSNSYAANTAECKPEELEKIKKNANTKAFSVLKNFKNIVNNYHSAATQYASTCNQRLNENTPVMLSAAAQQSLIKLLDNNSSAGVSADDIVRGDNYKYTGVIWNQEHPKSAQCQKLKNRAASLLNNYTAVHNQAENILGFIRSDENVPISCMCDNNGRNAECASYAASEDLKEAKDQVKGCEPFSTYLSELTGCPLCPIFSTVLTADATLASVGWESLAGNLQKIILTFFLAYLAFVTLKNISSPSGAGTGGYLRSVIGLGLKVAITYYLLSNAANIYGYFISPVIMGGLDMGLALLSIGSPGVQTCIQDKAAMFSAVGGGELDAKLLGTIYKTVDCFSQSAATMPAIGRALMCYGWESGNILPDFSMWFTGLVIYLFGLGIWMVIGFYLIDCTVQLGILCGIVPILIACWPFKVTTKYASKGVTMLMNTFFNFAFAGMMLVIGMKIIGYSAGGKSGDLSTFRKALNENNLKKLEELASLDGVETLILIACCIFAFKLIGIINGTAEKFAKSSGSNIGAKIGGAAASAATMVAKGGAHMAGSVASATGSYIANETAVGKAVSKGVGKVGGAVKGAALGAAARGGKLVGLKRFQPKAQQGMPAISNTAPHGTKGGNTPNGNTPNGGDTPNGNTPNSSGTSNGGDTSNSNTPNGDNKNSPYMFPPQEHNTGNADMDAKLNQMDQNGKNGYNTGDKEFDKKMNDQVRQGLKNDEDFIKQQGYNMSVTEYRDAQKVLDSFYNTDKAKELDKQIKEAAKNDVIENGARWYCKEHREAIKNQIDAQHDYVKNNFNERTYQNCKTLQKNSNFIADDSKWKQG